MITIRLPGPAAASFFRRRNTCESSVRVRACALSPHTSRSSSSRVNTRVGSRDQRPEELVFLRGQRDRPLADADLARSVVDGQRADPAQRAGRGSLCSAQERADPSAQLRVGERLGDHVVAAAVEHANARELVRARGQHDHRRVRVELADRRRAAAYRVEQRERLTVQVGEHELRPVRAQQRQRVPAAIGQQDLVAVRRQLLGEEGARVLALLDDQDQL